MKRYFYSLGRPALFFLVATFSLEAKVAAKFEALSGIVQFREKNGKWQNARIGTSLNTDTELQTSATGRATLLFPNGSKVTLNPGTLASLDQYATGNYGSQTTMSLRLGRMNADIAKVNSANTRNHFRVRTPTIVAGVRGTVEEVGYSPDKGSDVKLVESSADVVDKNGRASVVPQGGSSHITTGGTTTADQQATKSNTVTMVASESATAGESEAALSSGDFSFSSNLSDLNDLFDLFDLFEGYEFSGTVTFEKL
jgi:hypothetical protein